MKDDPKDHADSAIGIIGTAAEDCDAIMKLAPGAILVRPGTLELNEGLERRECVVTNSGDRPVQVGSHYHFQETNPALRFDRQRTRGFRLDIPAGTAVRFEPGQSRTVALVAYAGKRQVHGFRAGIAGALEADATPPGTDL